MNEVQFALKKNSFHYATGWPRNLYITFILYAYIYTNCYIMYVALERCEKTKLFLPILAILYIHTIRFSEDYPKKNV